MIKEEKIINKVLCKISKILLKAEKHPKHYYKYKNKAQLYALKKGINIKNEECEHQYIECCYNSRHSDCSLKSIEKHDAELKAKWCDELMEWYFKKIKCVFGAENIYDLTENSLAFEVYKKLEQMKGEKDE